MEEVILNNNQFVISRFECKSPIQSDSTQCIIAYPSFIYKKRLLHKSNSNIFLRQSNLCICLAFFQCRKLCINVKKCSRTFFKVPLHKLLRQVFFCFHTNFTLYSIDFPLLFFVKSINFINLQVTFTKTGYTIIDYKVMKIPGAKNLRNCPYFQK